MSMISEWLDLTRAAVEEIRIVPQFVVHGRCAILN